MKLLIFDFDGTIADTRSLYGSVMNSELSKFGFSKKNISKAVDIGLSLRKTLGKLGLNFIVSWVMHKRILKKVKRLSSSVKKCKDADSIKKIPYKKIIVTNSLKEFAVPVLRHLKLRKVFSEVYGADDFSDKGSFIYEYLKKRKINREDCFYIGDRIADVLLAREAGINSVIVLGKCAWDSRKEILDSKPDFIIEDLRDLSRVVESF